MRRIFIFGCGGSGREMLQIVLDMAQAGEPVEPVAFVIDAEIEAPERVHTLPVLRGLDAVRGEATEVVIALGSPVARRHAARRLEEMGLRSATLIHPRSWIGREVVLGPGTVVCAQSALASDIRLGSHVHVNIACSVSHDCRLGDFATLAPGVHLAGRVTLDEGAELGVGACAIPGTTIGRWAMVGGGAAVTKDIPPNAVAVGVPARPVRRRSEGWHELP